MAGEESLREIVAGNVRAERARARIRQTELAVALGLSQSATSALEGGQREITLSEAGIICRILHVPLADLLKGADDDIFEAFGIPRA